MIKCPVVGAVRATYIVFGSYSSKSTKFGTNVSQAILFRFLKGAKTSDPWSRHIGRFNMAAKQIDSYKTNRAWIMNNTTFMGLSGYSGSLILILFQRFEVKVTSQGLHKCHSHVKFHELGLIVHLHLFWDAQLKNNTQRIDALWDDYPE